MSGNICVMFWFFALMNSIAAVVIASEIGNKRRIGFIFSLVFSLCFSFVVGLIITLLSPPLSKELKQRAILRYILTGIFALMAIGSAFMGHEMSKAAEQLSDPYSYSYANYSRSRETGYQNSKILFFTLAIGFLTAVFYTLPNKDKQEIV